MVPPADEEPEPVGLEPALLVLVLLVVLLLLLLHAARTPGMAASPAAPASPLMAARRENAPDLAGVEGLSVMATPRGNVQKDRAAQRTEQNMSRM
jgi:hypothetical protein